MLYFYPKDDTSGCTKEAIAFAEVLDKFNGLDAVVVGASRDSIVKHKKFEDMRHLGVALICDEDSAFCQDYGV